MKKSLIFLLALGGSALAGCKKDFLDLSPVSSSSAANFFQTQGQIEQAVNAAYVPLRNLTNEEYWVYGEMRSDNTSFQYNNTARGQETKREYVDEFLVPTSSESVLSFWQSSYNGISRCNDVLGHVDAVSMSADKKNQYTSEAKFLRALYYYNLVRQYGGVPLRLESVASPADAKSQGRATADAVYTQIIKDLTDAATALPAKTAYSGADIGRATKGAAQTLLASVYLTRKDYPNALTQLRAVRGAGYSLLPSYRNVFDPANKNNAESIFEVQYVGSLPALSSNFTFTFAPYTSSNFVTGDAATRTLGEEAGWNIPTPELIAAYEPGDLRKDASLKLGYTDGSGNFVAQPYTSKYNFGVTAPRNTNTDFPILRYSEVLLMLAECLNEQGYAAGGEAFDALNQVRRRAGLPDKTAADLGSQAAFRDAVLQERRVELAMENKRWYDLVRTGRAVDVMNAQGVLEKARKSFLPASAYQVTPNKILLPIPQYEVTLDGLEQNPQ